MSQLIITVIAIALSAALGMVGVYYIGDAFIDAKDKSVALQYVAEGAQIAAAWKSWSKSNGTQYLSDIHWFTTGSTDLVPEYLTELPKPPLPLDTNYFTWLPIKLTAPATTGSAPDFYSADANVTGIRTWLAATAQGKRVCKHVAILSQGASAAPAILSSDMTPRNNAQFDCFYTDTNANTALDVGENAYIVYRIF